MVKFLNLILITHFSFPSPRQNENKRQVQSRVHGLSATGVGKGISHVAIHYDSPENGIGAILGPIRKTGGIEASNFLQVPFE